ncbi:right-handed parallel beta-helix repeat-containing protein [Sandaracinobacteroides saxicola]|uniref:Right handed beta helix domain-containing protein n=1 Tax=Sandaracinobacteroides saxicola TaxID=2759707 RepID=A0A7G5IFS1_9SPHN|nr:hypothetical protein [Sandaracinobacteroides saxicola]QMW22213.1 hypothetical protein H3309_12685 [Sandaracinobacteroides saxicola]
MIGCVLRALAVLCATWTGAVQATAIFTVSSAAELTALLRTLTQPAEVQLSPGNYGEVRLTGVTARVTLRSANPAARATFDRLWISDSAAVTVSGIDIALRLGANEGVTTAGMLVRNSRDISLVDMGFSGSPDDNPNNDGLLLRLLNVTRALVLNCRFAEARAALFVERSRGVIVASSEVSIAREGFNFSTVQSVLVDRNRFTAIRPNLDAGDHADAIQFFVGAGSGSSGVTISNNAMLLHDTVSQGIFVRNESGLAANAFRNFAILNNAYVGQVRNGVTVIGLEGGLIAGNTLLAAPGWVLEPALTARDSIDIVMERNIAPWHLFINTPGAAANSVTLANRSNPGGPGVNSQVTGDPAVAPLTAGDFTVRPGSLAATLGAGFVEVGFIGVGAAEQGSARMAALLAQLATMAPD